MAAGASDLRGWALGGLLAIGMCVSSLMFGVTVGGAAGTLDLWGRGSWGVLNENILLVWNLAEGAKAERGEYGTKRFCYRRESLLCWCSSLMTD